MRFSRASITSSSDIAAWKLGTTDKDGSGSERHQVARAISDLTELLFRFLACDCSWIDAPYTSPRKGEAKGDTAHLSARGGLSCWFSTGSVEHGTRVRRR